MAAARYLVFEKSYFTIPYPTSYPWIVTVKNLPVALTLSNPLECAEGLAEFITIGIEVDLRKPKQTRRLVLSEKAKPELSFKYKKLGEIWLYLKTYDAKQVYLFEETPH